MKKRLVFWHIVTCITASNLTTVCGQSLDELPADRAPVVIMAPNGPVFAEMRISVDGEGYRAWVTNLLAEKTDANHDGRLTLAELKMIPASLLKQTGLSSAKKALRRSTGIRDATSIPLRRFTPWFSRKLQQSFNITAGAVQASEAVRLASLIDSDLNGSITREEVAAGAKAMRFRDLDDDQTFSATELLPFRDPRNQQAAVVPEAVDLHRLAFVGDLPVQRHDVATNGGVGPVGEVVVDGFFEVIG